MKKEIGELEEAQTSPDFWDDMEKSQKIIQRTSMLKNKVSAYETLVSGYEDALTLIEMGDEEEDLSILPDASRRWKGQKRAGGAAPGYLAHRRV